MLGLKNITLKYKSEFIKLVKEKNKNTSIKLVI